MAFSKFEGFFAVFFSLFVMTKYCDEINKTKAHFKNGFIYFLIYLKNYSHVQCHVNVFFEREIVCSLHFLSLSNLPPF